jgi:hypothetical protein
MDADGPFRWATDGPGLSRSQIQPYLSGLIEAYERTAPDRNPDEVCPGKHKDALTTLQVAGTMLWKLIAWAVHHETGAIALGAEDQPACDLHRNEIEGAKYEGGNPLVSQRVVALLLRTLFPDWPPAQEVARALVLLPYGSVQPVVSPPKKKRDRAVELWKRQEKAVMWSAVRQAAYDEEKGEAQGIIAKAFGLSADAVRKWEERLPNRIGSGKTRDLLNRGREAGKIMRAQQSGDAPQTEAAKPLAAMLWEHWGDEALDAAGKEFIAETKRLSARDTKARKKRTASAV